VPYPMVLYVVPYVNSTMPSPRDRLTRE
jgi:hypothetical protein